MTFPDPAHGTVHAAFAAAAARWPDAPFLRLLPETAAAYGIDAGDLATFVITIQNTGGADAFDVEAMAGISYSGSAMNQAASSS